MGGLMRAGFTGLWSSMVARDQGRIEAALGVVVEALERNRQWGVAQTLLRQLEQNAQTAAGRDTVQQLQRDGTRRRWEQFLSDLRGEIPVLIISGVVTAGIGTVAEGAAVILRAGVTLA